MEQWIEQDARTYNSHQLVQKLAEHQQVQLSPRRLRYLLQKRAFAGNERVIITPGKQDPEQKRLKQADLETLKLAAQDGYIDLKYLDESGCCLWSPVSYSYSRIGEQKRLEQTERRGRRISILGLWQPGERFEYALACGSFKSASYIKVMDWVADQAAQTLGQTGRLTVIVQDNGSSHTSRLTQQQWQRWQKQGLFLFFLPEYCSEMNRIEDEWHQLKTHEIAGQMFEDEYELAIAVIAGMEARSNKGGYTLERFKFNSG